MARCRSCEAEVIWADTKHGKKMPLDAKPTSKGNLVFVGGVARTVTDEDRRLHRETYTSHFSTCADAGDWRKR
jgi:hypothetical protein